MTTLSPIHGRARRAVLAALLLLASAAATSASAASAGTASALPSWNDSASRRAIVDFVERVTTEGSPDFVAPAERIAVFDNDGTLWSEQPIYNQLVFAIDRIKALAPRHPAWSTTEPFASVLRDDVAGAFRGGHHAVLQLIDASHTGMTTQEFDRIAREWIDTARHPTTGRLYRDMTFRPMIELLDYFRAKGFKTYIVSGGGVDFMRSFAEEAYGFPPEQVIGSFARLEWTIRDGTPLLMKKPGIAFNANDEGKPVAIESLIGRRPLAAFGNSDGDLAMLQWTCSAPGPRLCAYVHHTDGEREFAYDRGAPFGELDKGLDEAEAKGWTLIDMKNDWATVYGDARSTAR